MVYIALDGDDIGRQITGFYLKNDAAGLSLFADLVNDKVKRISRLFESSGYDVIFCAADGVVAETEASVDVDRLYEVIASIGTPELTFSMGVGNSLRESYVALLAAKSSGKARLTVYREI